MQNLEEGTGSFTGSYSSMDKSCKSTLLLLTGKQLVWDLFAKNVAF